MTELELTELEREVRLAAWVSFGLSIVNIIVLFVVWFFVVRG